MECGVSRKLERGECKKNANCCIQRGENINLENNFDNKGDLRITWATTCYKRMNCEVYVRLEVTNFFSCYNFYRNDIQFDNEVRQCRNTFYSLNKTRFIEGQCHSEEKCCIRLTRAEPKTYKKSNDDVCKLHIGYLSSISQTINDIETWRNNGELVLGKTCWW